jgi:hypothetical protein
LYILPEWDLNLLACSLARQKSAVIGIGRSRFMLLCLVREHDAAEHRLEVK